MSLNTGLSTDDVRRQQQPVHAESARRPESLISPVVGFLLVANGAVFLAANVLQLVSLEQLALAPDAGQWWPQLLTHMFAHGNLAHLLGNMLIPLFLGPPVERIYGPWRFSLLYLLSGLTAVALQVPFLQTVPADLPGGLPQLPAMLGASGAIAGIMAAFLRHFPREKLYVYGIIPLPTWAVMVLYVVINAVGQASGQGQVAWLAHLGGFAGGYIVSMVLLPPRTIRGSGGPTGDAGQ